MKVRALALVAVLVCAVASSAKAESWWSSHHQAGKRNVQQNGQRILTTARSYGTAFNAASGGAFAKGYASAAGTVTGQPWVMAPAYVVGKRAPEASVGVGMSAYYYGRGFVRGR